MNVSALTQFEHQALAQFSVKQWSAQKKGQIRPQQHTKHTSQSFFTLSGKVECKNDHIILIKVREINVRGYMMLEMNSSGNKAIKL